MGPQELEQGLGRLECYVSTYVYVYTYMYMYIYIYIYAHTWSMLGLKAIAGTNASEPSSYINSKGSPGAAGLGGGPGCYNLL